MKYFADIQPHYAVASAFLRIMATSDLHLNLRGYDYIRQTKTSHNGLARLARVINEARRETAHSVLLDNGDALQGSALIEGLRDGAAPHPMAQAFDALQYDAIGLGNHDFDFGLPYLSNVLDQYKAPVVCSNLVRRTDTQTPPLPQVHQSIILNRMVVCDDGMSRLLRIGILSVVPEQTLIWNHASLGEHVSLADMLSTAKEVSENLRQNGADIVILLAHSGIGNRTISKGSENASLAMASIPGIDAIIAGHTHDRFPNPRFTHVEGANPIAGTLENLPAAMPGYGGSHLALIDLALSTNPSGGWDVKQHQSQLRAACDVALEDDKILNVSQDAHTVTQSFLSRKIGSVPCDVHSYFSLVQSSGDMGLIAQAMQHEIKGAAKETPHADLPILAAVAPCAAGGLKGPANFVSIPKGPLTQRHIRQLCPYEDEIWAVRRTGHDIREWLERAAGAFFHIRPQCEQTDQTQAQYLIDASVPSFNFDVIHGLEYQVDVSQPRTYSIQGDLIDPQARRIQNMVWQGKPLDLDQEFLVACNSFRAAGGGNFPKLFHDSVTLRTQTTIQEALVTLCSNNRNQAQPYTPAWRLATGLGITAILETAPIALNHLNDISAYTPKPLRQSERGFLGIQLSL